MSVWDAIVLGVGGVGSAALSTLARRGVRVLGIDRFHPPHDRGSSHGQTRMIRQAYFEHSDYVPLVLRSYELWNELSDRCGVELFQRTGLLQLGASDSRVVQGVLASADLHQLPIELLSPDEIAKRWRGFHVPSHLVGIYEPAAGYLTVEGCVQAQLDDAVTAGATVHLNEAVLDWKSQRETITVQTDKGLYQTARLVIAAGPWAGQWLTDSGVNLTVLRKIQFWFATNTGDYQSAIGCPAFLFDTADGVFYGFPEIESGQIKVAEHSGGSVVADPTVIDREVRSSESSRVESFVANYLPGVSRNIVRALVCMYTMSPDTHFVVDHHPHDRRVVFAAGLSGHGFKFAPVLGQALAELALDGRANLPIDFLRLDRFRESDAASPGAH